MGEFAVGVAVVVTVVVTKGAAVVKKAGNSKAHVHFLHWAGLFVSDASGSFSLSLDGFAQRGCVLEKTSL
jgi:hypothetical protein